jgi:Acyltransferase family
MTGTGLSHYPSLDGVRGIAVLSVVMAHAQALIFSRPILGWFDFSGGFIGVDIFFVLSGFLITSLLLQEHQSSGTINLKNFYVRRALRLLPALVLLLVAMLIYARLALSAEIFRQTLRFAGIVILYITNWMRVLSALAPSVIDSLETADASSRVCILDRGAYCSSGNPSRGRPHSRRHLGRKGLPRIRHPSRLFVGRLPGGNAPPLANVARR